MTAARPRRPDAQPRRPAAPLPVVRAAHRSVVAAAVLGLAGVVGLAGCSSGRGATPLPASPTPTPTEASPTTASPAPGPADSLAGRGFRHGPADLPLPDGLAIVGRVDNPNNVTLLVDHDQGRSTYEFLRTRLPAAGFTVEAAAGQSLVFSGQGWSGGYTVSPDLAALTLRADPAS